MASSTSRSRIGVPAPRLSRNWSIVLAAIKAVQCFALCAVKQFAALENADGRNSALLLHGSFQGDFNTQRIIQTLILDGVTYEIKVGITGQDPVTQELQVSLDVLTKDSAGSGQFPRHAEFWISSFDFPMIDNTRLLNNQFCALVMKVFESDETQKDTTYELHVVCFPGSRAALQEKPYYDEILDHLRRLHP